MRSSRVATAQPSAGRISGAAARGIEPPRQRTAQQSSKDGAATGKGLRSRKGRKERRSRKGRKGATQRTCSFHVPATLDLFQTFSAQRYYRRTRLQPAEAFSTLRIRTSKELAGLYCGAVRRRCAAASSAQRSRRRKEGTAQQRLSWRSRKPGKELLSRAAPADPRAWTLPPRAPGTPCAARNVTASAPTSAGPSSSGAEAVRAVLAGTRAEPEGPSDEAGAAGFAARPRRGARRRSRLRGRNSNRARQHSGSQSGDIRTQGHDHQRSKGGALPDSPACRPLQEARIDARGSRLRVLVCSAPLCPRMHRSGRGTAGAGCRPVLGRPLRSKCSRAIPLRSSGEPVRGRLHVAPSRVRAAARPFRCTALRTRPPGS